MELSSAERIGEGRASEVFAWGEGRVLKLLRPWQSETWGDREFRSTAAAHAAGLPAPRVYGMERLGGRLGMVLERVEGPSLLQVLARQPWRAGAVARHLAEVQARVHAGRMAGLEPLTEKLRWWIARAPLPADVLRRAEEALARMPPGDAVCHGDLHPDNVVLTARGPVVIDWSEAAAGPALADVVRTSLMLRFASPPTGSLGLLQEAGRRWIHRTWLRRSLRLAGARPEDLRPYLLPVAVARAGQRIENEAAALRAFIASLPA
jgi:thiamine kinase